MDLRQDLRQDLEQDGIRGRSTGGSLQTKETSTVSLGSGGVGKEGGALGTGETVEAAEGSS